MSEPIFKSPQSPRSSRVSAGVKVSHVLVYDTDSNSSRSLVEALRKQGFAPLHCSSPDHIVETVDERVDRAKHGWGESASFDAPIVWGLGEPFEESLAALTALRSLRPELKILVLAPHEALAFGPAIRAAGIDKLILKPVRAADLAACLERMPSSGATGTAAVSKAVSKPDVETKPVPKTPAKDPYPRFAEAAALNQEDGRDLGLIGASSEMKKIFALIRKVGPSTCNVLITGESGSGKEMVASAIHKVSDRAKKPFIAINCAAIPRELLESELFGHAKGAFTGATVARRGLFEEAHEGTILLDEIGDLPLALQAKILRLLQTRQVKPLGQNVVKEVDVRIVSATHKNLKSLIQKGEFREDLYYRLNVMPIHLPPLRDRHDDILLLAEHFLRRNADRRRGVGPTLSKRAASKLQGLPWKGNVRELENVIERAIVLSDGVTITEDEVLSEELEATRVTSEDLFAAGMSLKDIEREYIKYVLSRTGNRKEAAIRILGIDRKTLYRKEKLYGIRSITDLN